MNKTRLNLEISKQTRDAIDALVEAGAGQNITDVVCRSLRLFESVNAHCLAGGKVVLRGADGTEETVKLL